MLALFNRTINLLKWPSALVLAWFLPGFLGTFAQSLHRLGRQMRWTWPLVAGMVLFVFLYRRFWRRNRVLMWLWTFEHEASHAVFAWMTGHRVTHFRVRAGSGLVKYRGHGNWLIHVAPYFFPLGLLFVLGILLGMDLAQTRWGLLLIGFVLASTILHMVHEFHRDQPDLHEVGFAFAYFFIPAGNLATWGLFLFFVLQGPSGFGAWWWDCTRLNAVFWRTTGLL